MSPTVQFILIALLCALGLWILAQFPTLDATVVKLIRLAVLVLLSILFINLMLLLLLGHGLPFYLTGTQ